MEYNNDHYVEKNPILPEGRMQGKLQELTDKIYQEGVGKARDESDRIIKEAKGKADSIIDDAKKEAEALVERAKKDSAELKNNVASEIRLAGQQAVSALKQEISGLIVDGLVDAQVSDAYKDSGFIKKIIETAVSAWGPTEESLILELPESTKSEFEGYLKGGALDKIKKGLEVKYSSSLEGGFRVGPEGSGFLVSFTDEGFSNFFKEYLRPRASKFLFGE